MKVKHLDPPVRDRSDRGRYSDLVSSAARLQGV